MERKAINKEEYLKWRSERQRRVRVVAATVPALIGVAVTLLAILLPNYIEYIGPFSRSLFSFIPPVMFLLSGFAILMIYLQTGFSKKLELSTDILRYEDELENIKNHIAHGNGIGNNEFNKLKNEIDELKEELLNNSSINAAITAEHKEELVILLKKEILDKSTDQASLELLQKLQNQIVDSDNSKEIESIFSRTLERLYKETSALSRRGNLNLSLGILTTIVGLAILGYFVVEIDSVPEDKVAFIAYFIPRLSLVILIEVFAYFFLKLYKSSLGEIKYFQNEMTNTEAKYIALKCSYMSDDGETTAGVIKILSETERNAVLEKGQTTAEIEKSKIEHQNINSISDKVSKIIGGK